MGKVLDIHEAMQVKDIIIRGGENIVRLSVSLVNKLAEWALFQDSVSVENALYADPRVREAAVVGVPDERLGELVAAIVSLQPGQVKRENKKIEESLIEQVRRR